MKKWFYLITVCIAFNSIGISQCDGWTTESEIRNEHRSSTFIRIGMLDYNDYTQGPNSYYSDFDTPAFTIGFAKAIWVSGIDHEGMLRVAANEYTNGTNRDYIPGRIKC